MKKIGILTIHYGVNFGSALQSYAMCNYLNRNGAEAKIINYIPKRYSIWQELLRKKSHKYNKLIIGAYYPIALARKLPNRRRFEKFLNTYVPMTQKFSEVTQIADELSDLDVYVAGSDQIWNSDYNGSDNLTYYYSFLPRRCKKVAYAASFGKKYPLPSEEVEAISGPLTDFSAISVREANAVDILNQCGVNGIHVCDPTFLLSEAEWSAFADGEFDENYLLVYVMDGIYKNLLDNAEIIAKRLGLKIFVICFDHISDRRIDKIFTNADPKMFVSLIKNAKFVVTNSFHGTAFSVLFRKKLLVVKKEKYNERMTSLLDKVNMNKRTVEHNELIQGQKLEEILGNIDEKSVNDSLQPFIDSSKVFIQNHILGEVND